MLVAVGNKIGQVQALKNKRKENFLVIDVFFNELFDATTSQFLPL